jgi:hypothetical protein
MSHPHATWTIEFQRLTLGVGNSTRHGSDMEGDTKYDSTHKYWELAIETCAELDPVDVCATWDMADAWDAEDAAHRARQCAGLEPPDDYPMIADELPPEGAEELQEAAERLCGMLQYHYDDKCRRLGKLIQATILGDGRPAHRPPSSHIAKRDERIVEQIEYWRAKKRQMKAILPDIGKRYRLSARAVKKIWDARERKVT